MAGLRVLLGRIKRNWLKKPFLKDPAFPSYWFDQALAKDNAFLVQIGSNDGKTGDPLYPLLQKHKHWKALFVEPVPYVFEKLKANYADATRFICENVAINNGETLEFHWVDPIAKKQLPDLPYWFDQLGSFHKEHLLKHLDGQLAPYIISQKLQGIRLPDLLAKHQIQTIDLLHIDTEGYDWAILSQINLEIHRPKFILYEYKHLSAADLQKSLDFLKGYQIFNIGIDILAVDQNLDAAFRSKLSKALKTYPFPKE